MDENIVSGNFFDPTIAGSYDSTLSNSQLIKLISDGLKEEDALLGKERFFYAYVMYLENPPLPIHLPGQIIIK